MNNYNLPNITEHNSYYKYLLEVNKIPSLSAEEEYLLAKSFINDNELEAAHKLVRSHLKLVVKIAYSYKRYGLPAIDVISEGNIGLMHAVKKFDPELGFRLSTYAMWWIKASIQEYILKSWSLVKIGTTATQKKLFFSLGKIKHQIYNVHHRNLNEADYSKIASDLGVKPTDVKDMNLRLTVGDMSLNQPVNYGGEENNSEIIDLLPEQRPSQEVALIHKKELDQKKLLLIEACKNLNEREKDIFYARKLQEQPTTLDILSSKYSISKERVRQIENRAFEKVQNYMLSQHA